MVCVPSENGTPPHKKHLKPSREQIRTSNMSAKTSRAEFEAVFPQLVQDVSQEAQKYNIPPEALNWFQRVCSSAT